MYAANLTLSGLSKNSTQSSARPAIQMALENLRWSPPCGNASVDAGQTSDMTQLPELQDRFCTMGNARIALAKGVSSATPVRIENYQKSNGTIWGKLTEILAHLFPGIFTASESRKQAETLLSLRNWFDQLPDNGEASARFDEIACRVLAGGRTGTSDYESLNKTILSGNTIITGNDLAEICRQMEDFLSPAAPARFSAAEDDCEIYYDCQSDVGLADDEDEFVDALEEPASVNEAPDIISSAPMSPTEHMARLEKSFAALDQEINAFISTDVRNDYFGRLLNLVGTRLKPWQVLEAYSIYRSAHEYFLGTPASEGGGNTEPSEAQPGLFDRLDQTLASFQTEIGDFIHETDELQNSRPEQTGEENQDGWMSDEQTRRLGELFGRTNIARAALDMFSRTLASDKAAITHDFALLGHPDDFSIPGAYRVFDSLQSRAIARGIRHSEGDKWEYLERKYSVSNIRDAFQNI